MLQSERLKTTSGLYFDYLIHGMALVILAQNMTVLGKQWGVGDAGVSYVISSFGIGRLIVLYVAGYLSDKLGRRLFVKIGIVTYTVFFIGILMSHTIFQAYVFGIFAGMANSFLDSGTYPALMEIYPNKKAVSNILIKAFASLGELLLPLLVAFLEFFNLWYGWSFVFCAISMILNFLFMWKRQFPDISNSDSESDNDDSVNSTSTSGHVGYKKIILGIVLTIFGYISMATFYLISQWLTQYGLLVVKLNLVNARMLVSIYSIGSILGVIVTVILVGRFIKPVWFMLGDTIVSFLDLCIMALFPVHSVMLIGSFIIGCSAASGVMQIGLTIMGDVFPKYKGRVTGIYYTTSALASFTIPVFTGILSKTSVHSIMWFDAFIALAGVLCSILVMHFLKQINIASEENII